jgi:hypothetical protein
MSSTFIFFYFLIKVVTLYILKLKIHWVYKENRKKIKSYANKKINKFIMQRIVLFIG